MVSLNKVENLKQAHLDYIIVAFARTTNPNVVKDEFQKFFNIGISGEIIVEISGKYKDNINLARTAIPFDEKARDTALADPIQRLNLLDDLRKLCLEEKIFNVTRDGTPLTKTEYATALRCIEAAGKIYADEKMLELKRLALMQGNTDEGEGPTTDGETTSLTDGEESSPKIPKFSIVHKM